MDRSKETEALRKKISETRKSLDRSLSELMAIEKNCRHVWGETRYVPEYKEGYEILGDPPGTCGIDWRGAAYIPAITIKRWQRTCRLCGKTEVTEQTNKIYSEEPKF